MTEDYKAIDFVQMYMNRIPNEPEFDRLDDMLRAAAVLTVEADKVLEKAQQARNMEAEVIHKIVKHAPPEEVPALRLIVESILRTAEYGADIAEVVLNMTVKDIVTEVS